MLSYMCINPLCREQWDMDFHKCPLCKSYLIPKERWKMEFVFSKDELNLIHSVIYFRKEEVEKAIQDNVANNDYENLENLMETRKKLITIMNKCNIKEVKKEEGYMESSSGVKRY